jgi:hypothetical protein
MLNYRSAVLATAIFATPLCIPFGLSAADATSSPVRTFLEQSCFDCHDTDTKKGQLDLSALLFDGNNPDIFATWVKVHDRVRAGEMPPPKEPRPNPGDLDRAMSALAHDLTAADTTRQEREGRGGIRRLSRVEFENSLRDLLGLPGLRLLTELPADGKSHGFDRAAGALDFSFVHMESYLAAVDKALNEATPAFVERPPVFKYRYRPWDNNRHEGRETEGAVANVVSQRNFIPLIGLERDPTFEAVKHWFIKDEEPFATALGVFRHEDADFRFSLTAIAPVLAGPHKLRVSAYSFWWDGEKVVSTDRTGAVGFGIHSTGEHFGTDSVPANEGGLAEVTAWLQRSGGHLHGIDNYLRLILASCENIRDFRHDENTLGPPHPCPGLAIEWIEIEGPIFEQWPPTSQRSLFGDLPVKEWTADSGLPKPVQQVWPNGNVGTFPKDIYGEKGQDRPIVHVVSTEPEPDARRLLSPFLRRAFRRPAAEADVDYYAGLFTAAMRDGTHFQDALKSAYRAALTSPDFLMVGARRDSFALASRLSALLWSSLPDDPLLTLAESGALAHPEILRAQTERMLNDPKAERFIADFTGQWLRLRELEANPPDKQLYPEFMPWLQESMLNETHAFFGELLQHDLSVTNFVRSDFAMLNEPLARHYGIPGVKGFDIRRVNLPPASPRGGFLTQGAVLKITANGTTTSPVKRGAFVMEQILGIVPTPPPPNIGSIEPNTQGATTIREQLEKHKRNTSCASCHVKMDPYGFALESFDVTGEWRDHYRVRGGAGDDKPRTIVNGHPINYHLDLPVDCTGQLPDGRPFEDIAGLRAMLAANEEMLARAFVGHLITYATGAPVSFADRAGVEEIVRGAKPSHYGVRSLLLETIQSRIFAQP